MTSWSPSPSTMGAINLGQVGGVEDQVKYLTNAVILPMKSPEVFAAWGVKPPKGVIFHGPPGTGKTLLAKALASDIGELTGREVKFFYHKGAELHSNYLGESERKLVKLFDVAKRNAPSILFFDEMDALCPSRDTAGRTCQAYVTIVSTFLGLMDSVKRGNVLVIGATNRLDAIDPAVRRPGRIDKQLFFPLPNAEGRKRILTIHTGRWPSHKPSEVLLKLLVLKTEGFSGADLAQLCDRTKKTAMSRPDRPVKVTQADWNKSLNSMRPSATRVYGSTAHIPEILHSAAHHLFKDDVGTLSARMKVLLPHKGPCSLDADRDRSLRRSLLVVDNIGDCTHLADKMHLAFASDPAIQAASKYTLDLVSVEERLASGLTVPAIISAIVGQISHATNDHPSILYVPAINFLYDSLVQMGGPNCGFSLFSALKTNVKGPGKLLVTTWAGPLESGPPELRSLFNSREVQTLSPPNEDERRAFFNTVFKTYEDQNWMDRKRIIESILTTTEDDTIEAMYLLHQTLSEANGDLKKMKEIVENFVDAKAKPE